MTDSRSFRQLMGCFATGITVVTLRNENNEPAGLTINSLTSVSLDPPLVLFCLDRKAHLYPTFRKATYFGVNILSEAQEEISQHFAYHSHKAQPKNMWDKPQDTCPLLRQTLGWMICKTTKIHKAGDHDIFIGEVIKLHKRAGEKNPLLYFHSRYRKIED
jgi:flavin reductase (DIM6/NTAB) family NADH-FMN oxidoreductase RutF